MEKTGYITPIFNKTVIHMESPMNAASVNKIDDAIFSEKNTEVSIKKQSGFENGTITVNEWNEDE